MLKKLSLLFFCMPVLANPGNYTVVCHAKTAEQHIDFSIQRMNDVNWQPPKFFLKINKKTFNLPSPDSSQNYGQTIKDIPLGLIYITATHLLSQKNNYNLELKGIPDSVKSSPKTKWSLKQEKNQCYDKNGHASFQAILSGSIVECGKTTELQPTLLQCTIDYNSGMSC